MKRRQPTAEQKAKAEGRRERFKELVKKVAAMSDEERAEIAMRCGGIVTCAGRTLSMTNTVLCILQNSKASMVGGFKQWLAAGRCVRKGEHGIDIWIPSVRSSNNAEDGTDDITSEVRFLSAVVFDITQTDEMIQPGPETAASSVQSAA